MPSKTTSRSEEDPVAAPAGRPAERSNGAAHGQTWRVEAARSARERIPWHDLPVWSGLGSVALLLGVLLFDGPSPVKYGMLVLAQLFYLMSIIRRA